MDSHHLTNRLTALTLQLGLATATAMVLWTTWTGYLLATGQIRPRLPVAAPPAVVMPAPVDARDCECQGHRKDELQVQRRAELDAT
ncbi:hypothetical protein ACG02S_10440 [Roseateles sp. DC23W]|uniref:Uncharacterized protein n=1 Tax=Pelomonas dachongensis TaxID=3299029 RepID=A0ABW7EM99_9BURK